MRVAATKIKKLSYVVPGYVWRQSELKFVANPECYAVIERGHGVIIIGSPSLPRREYALTWCLSQVLVKDYHAKVGWLSWFPKEENEHTGAYYLKDFPSILAISVKEEATDRQLDQLRDLLVTRRLVFVACSQDPEVFAIRLHHSGHSTMMISANDARRDTL